MRGAIVYILQVDHSEVLTVSNMHDGLDLCSRQPRIMHAPGLPTPTPAKGSAASRAYDVSAVQRESLPIIILHSRTQFGQVPGQCQVSEDCHIGGRSRIQGTWRKLRETQPH